jgi:predicted MFS family arabinose efflux permease
MPFYRVLGLIWRPGLGLACATMGFGAIAAFGVLLFQERHWEGASFALTAFGASYIGARLFFGGLPDRLGGARVALGSVLIELVGQVLLWQARGRGVAIVGAALTGFGFSLAFPSFGVEAVRRVPPQNRGVALGGYTAFFDVALGVIVPLAGGIVRGAGYQAAFLLGALGSLFALAVALRLKRAA